MVKFTSNMCMRYALISKDNLNLLIDKFKTGKGFLSGNEIADILNNKCVPIEQYSTDNIQGLHYLFTGHKIYSGIDLTGYSNYPNQEIQEALFGQRRINGDPVFCDECWDNVVSYVNQNISGITSILQNIDLPSLFRKAVDLYEFIGDEPTVCDHNNIGEGLNCDFEPVYSIKSDEVIRHSLNFLIQMYEYAIKENYCMLVVRSSIKSKSADISFLKQYRDQPIADEIWDSFSQEQKDSILVEAENLIDKIIWIVMYENLSVNEIYLKIIGDKVETYFQVVYLACEIMRNRNLIVMSSDGVVCLKAEKYS